jgi:hypothetical protein
MKHAQFEYCVVSMQDSVPQIIQSMLDEHGEMGWELINVIGGPTVYYYFFKRQLVTLNS